MGAWFISYWRIVVDEYFDVVVSPNVLTIVFDDFLIEGILYEQLLYCKQLAVFLSIALRLLAKKDWLRLEISILRVEDSVILSFLSMV
jgi:hypothetical protein